RDRRRRGTTGGGGHPRVDAGRPPPGAPVRLRLWLPPLLLAAAAAAVVVFAHRGALDPGEAAVLSGANLARRVREHLALSAVSTALAVAVAVPAGIAVTRPGLRRFGPPVLVLANAGQTIPTVAMLAL